MVIPTSLDFYILICQQIVEGYLVEYIIADYITCTCATVRECTCSIRALYRLVLLHTNFHSLICTTVHMIVDWYGLKAEDFIDVNQWCSNITP